MPRLELQVVRREEGDHQITWWFERPYPMGEGPWNDEPDKMQWIDEATGLDCLIVRAPVSGAWCGYVGVPPGHPLYDNADAAEEHLWPHGGITFQDFCEPGEPAYGICHVASAGAVEKPYWVGFDCAHAEDYPPAMEALTNSLSPLLPSLPGLPGMEAPTDRFAFHQHYWTVDEVRLLVAELAEQVARFPASGATEERA